MPIQSASSLCRLLDCVSDHSPRAKLLYQRSDLLQRHRQMPLDRRGDVLRRFEPVLGGVAVILQPGDIEIVAARGDLGAGEAAETAQLALVLAFDAAVGSPPKAATKS